MRAVVSNMGGTAGAILLDFMGSLIVTFYWKCRAHLRAIPNNRTKTRDNGLIIV